MCEPARPLDGRAAAGAPVDQDGLGRAAAERPQRRSRFPQEVPGQAAVPQGGQHRHRGAADGAAAAAHVWEGVRIIMRVIPHEHESTTLGRRPPHPTCCYHCHCHHCCYRGGGGASPPRGGRGRGRVSATEFPASRRGRSPEEHPTARQCERGTFRRYGSTRASGRGRRRKGSSTPTRLDLANKLDRTFILRQSVRIH